MLKVGLVSAAGEMARGVLEVGLAGALREGCQVRLYPAYSDLVDALAAGEEDVAWLPPVAYLRARRQGPVQLLASIERGGQSTYGCALLGRAEAAASFESARGSRAAWIDPWSAAGYLVPRALLRSQGHDPDAFFSAQTFVGDYRAALALLASGQADVTGCYARLEPHGQLAGGPWDEHPGLVVLASGGSIPNDTLCASAAVDPERLAHLRAALTGRLPPPALLVVLQTSALRPPVPDDYDAFEQRYDPR